jgi:hypothetical protein
MKPSEKEWKPFKINELFDVDKGIYLNKKDIIEGNIPFISAKAVDNGLTGFIGNRTLFPKNSVTIEKIKLSAYYQPCDFYCSHDVTVIQNENLDKEVSLFISAMIKRQSVKYSYGRQAQMNVVKRETVLLPVDSDENPDWEFMRNYIADKHRESDSKYTTYLKDMVSKLKRKDISSLEEKEWKEFTIEELFEIKSGVRLTKEDMVEGDRSFIGSTDSNNGITNFVSNANKSLASNVLGVNYNGSVCEAFYHPYECIFSDDVKHLVLKNHHGNKYIYLFFSSIIRKQKNKYTYGYKFNGTRMKRQIIMLPIDEAGEPDFEYMEQYIKNLMINKYSKYTNYKYKTP